MAALMMDYEVCFTLSNQDAIAAAKLLPPGLYRHYKGADYEVIGVARHSETEEYLALYRPLYGERGLWVRPLAMFCEDVVVNGESLPRFAWVGPGEGDIAQ